MNIRRDNGANNSSKTIRKLRNKKVRKKRLYNEYTKPLRLVNVEKIAKLTRIDEFSKKLKLLPYLLCEEVLREVTARYGIKIERLCVGLDRVHIATDIQPVTSVSKAFNLLTGESTYKLY